MIDVRKRKEYSFSSDLTGIKVILFALWYFASGVEHFCIGLKNQSPLLCRVTMECFEKAVKLFTSKEINNTGPVVSRNVKLSKNKYWVTRWLVRELFDDTMMLLTVHYSSGHCSKYSFWHCPLAETLTNTSKQDWSNTKMC